MSNEYSTLVSSKLRLTASWKDNYRLNQEEENFLFSACSRNSFEIQFILPSVFFSILVLI